MIKCNNSEQSSTPLSEGTFVVQKIMSDRIVDDQIQFLIKWKNYPKSQATWEPIHGLDRALWALNDWLVQQKKSKKKSRTKAEHIQLISERNLRKKQAKNMKLINVDEGYNNSLNQLQEGEVVVIQGQSKKQMKAGKLKIKVVKQEDLFQKYKNINSQQSKNKAQLAGIFEQRNESDKQSNAGQKQKQKPNQNHDAPLSSFQEQICSPAKDRACDKANIEQSDNTIYQQFQINQQLHTPISENVQLEVYSSDPIIKNQSFIQIQQKTQNQQNKIAKGQNNQGFITKKQNLYQINPELMRKLLLKNTSRVKQWLSKKSIIDIQQFQKKIQKIQHISEREQSYIAQQK